MDLKYLVTGCGRSGTVYMAKLLTSLGVPCGHETIFDFDGIERALERIAGSIPLKLSETSLRAKEDWVDVNTIVADASYMAAPYLDFFPDATIIHVVRHPVKVINSFCNYIHYFQNTEPNPSDPHYIYNYECFIHNHLGDLKSYPTPYERACYYYVAWNEMVEKHQRLFHRVEDDPTRLLDQLGIRKNEKMFVDRKANSYAKFGRNFMLDDLPSGDLKDRLVSMGRRYGYSMESENLLI
jgi:hypothetical protein